MSLFRTAVRAFVIPNSRYYKKNNGDLGTLSKLLGHTQISTTMIYAHIMKDSRVAGVSAFDDML